MREWVKLYKYVCQRTVWSETTKFNVGPVPSAKYSNQHLHLENHADYQDVTESSCTEEDVNQELEILSDIGSSFGEYEDMKTMSRSTTLEDCSEILFNLYNME